MMGQSYEEILENWSWVARYALHRGDHAPALKLIQSLAELSGIPLPCVDAPTRVGVLNQHRDPLWYSGQSYELSLEELSDALAEGRTDQHPAHEDLSRGISSCDGYPTLIEDPMGLAPLPDYSNLSPPGWCPHPG